MFKPIQSYIIACNPRTGSWLLTYALQDSGVAASPDEYFAPEIEEFWTHRFALESREDREFYRNYLTAVFRFGTSSDGFFGTKLLWQSVGAFTGRLREIPLYRDLETADLLPAVFPRLRVILLQRRDKVRAAVSRWRAATSGVWAVALNGEPAWRSPLEPLPPDFRSQTISDLHDLAHAEEDAWVQLATDMRIPCLRIQYEDLVAAWDSTLRQVLTFLGRELPQCTPMPQPRLRRQADDATKNYASAWRLATGGCAACEDVPATGNLGPG
jgi:LPS sulfotransferase NodH